MEDRCNWHTKFRPCWYANNLLNKLVLKNAASSNQINLLEVKKAIYYAKKYHGDQKRQSGEPYYSHPLAVAFMVSDYIFRTDILVTSILHDTVEDTALSFEMIKIIFGVKVANQVQDLTRVKADRKISSAEMVESLWRQHKYDLLVVKQFDRLHNMQTVAVKSAEKIQKIVKETLGTFAILATYLEMPELRHALIQNCFKAMCINQNSPDHFSF